MIFLTCKRNWLTVPLMETMMVPIKEPKIRPADMVKGMAANIYIHRNTCMCVYSLGNCWTMLKHQREWECTSSGKHWISVKHCPQLFFKINILISYAHTQWALNAQHHIPLYSYKGRRCIGNSTLEFRDHVDIMKLSVYDVENKNAYLFYFIDKHYIALTFTSMHILL